MPLHLGHCRSLLPVLLLVFSAPAFAQTEPAACEATARIGLTPERVRELRLTSSPCQVVTTGNEYQLLDWLENGAIDAALLPPFAAELVLQSSTDEALKLFRATSVLPFVGAETPTYVVGLEILEHGVASIDPASRFDELLAADSLDLVIHAQSHLDPGFIALLAYTEQRVAAFAPEKKQAVFEKLLRSLEFGRTPANVASKPVAIRIGTLTPGGDKPKSWLDLDEGRAASDVVVYNTRLTSLLWSSAPEEATLAPSRGTVSLWLRNDRPSSATPQALFDFLQNNYRVAHAGSRQHRHFRFTVPELFAILRDEDAARPGDDPFGLVLTGGGVKAAYQTSVVQHLYEQRLLVNGAESGSGASEAIKVDHIIGTSGGALLGIFVSAIGDTVPDLTASLWKTADGRDFIASYDVFPFLELPRYLSAVLSLMIFGVVCTAFYGIVTFLAKRGHRAEPGSAFANVFSASTLPREIDHEEGPVNLFRPGAMWVVLLVLAPWMLKFITGQDVLEHVPAIAGLFYMVFAVIAIYSDNRVIHLQPFKWRDTTLNLIELLGFALAIVVIFVPLLIEKIAPIEWTAVDLLFGRIDVDVLISCLGFLALFLLLHRRIAHCPNVRLVPCPLILQAFLVLTLVVVLPQIVLFATSQPTYELSLAFWLYLAAFSLVTALLVLAVAHWPGWEPSSNPVRRTVDFLTASFPRLTYTQKRRRLGRITLFFAMSFAYWNFVMAPALYGNERAEGYLADTFAKFVCANNQPNTACEAPRQSGLSWAPKTKFVMSATSLEQQEERYFLFHPQRFDGSCAESLDKVDQGLLRELASIDRRWRIPHCKLSDMELLEAAFSSGSPFPVFPSKQVTIHEGSRLVDGGFAHNMPIEASVKLGARRTLVVSSSPLHQHDTRLADGGEIFTRGFLFHNLGRLFPYLFTRSQVEDALSAQDSLVATISPLDRGAEWPLLTDFHPSKIAYLIDKAHEDFDARIGLIESWGAPPCTTSGGVVTCRNSMGTDL